jgi:hypothetical protein
MRSMVEGRHDRAAARDQPVRSAHAPPPSCGRSPSPRKRGEDISRRTPGPGLDRKRRRGRTAWRRPRMFPMFALAMGVAGPLRPAPREREGVVARLAAGRQGEGVGHPQYIADSGGCRKMVFHPFSKIPCRAIGTECR